ncbi:hypothetical protein BGX28_000163 [Mortierella sp. GBA30]|nr:hypothetical protein BGX28_000163 [Mortierella sp. GBA30]
MAEQNTFSYTVDSLLANTLQLHRQLDGKSSAPTTSTTQQPSRIPEDSLKMRTDNRAGARAVTGSEGKSRIDGLAAGSTPSVRDRVTARTSQGHGNGSDGTETTNCRLQAGSPHVGPGSSWSSPLMSSVSPSTCPSPPSTATMSTFSSPQIPRLPSASTFVSGAEILLKQQEQQQQPQSGQPKELVADETQNPELSSNPVESAAAATSKVGSSDQSTTNSTSAPYTRSYTKSLSAGTPLQPPLQLHQPQQNVRRAKTSLSALASLEHDSRPVHHVLGQDTKDDTSVVAINVRYVSKDLWIRIELPRSIRVCQARDLILQKCQLTMAPPSAPSSVADTLFTEDDVSPLALGKKVEDRSQKLEAMGDKQGNKPRSETETAEVTQPNQDVSDNLNKALDKSKESTSNTSTSAQKALSCGDVQSTGSDRSTAKSPRSHNRGGTSEKTAQRPQLSLENCDDEMRADVLAARWDMFADSIHGFGDDSAKINYCKAITHPSQTHSQSQDAKRLLSSTSWTNDDGLGTNPADRSNRENGANRLGQFAGWSQWRDRHNSQPGKHFERSLLDRGDLMLFNCSGDDPTHQNEATKKDCDEWKASFGLFWVAAGHWLDDSRLINSYSLQPQDLLELQLRNHYIQLPPPGGDLSYSDHYAEGVLFKLSKKSRPVSMLTHYGGKECGVWKERWVVLQGSRLLIYHKRKDTTKKTMELPLPVTVMTRTLPHSSRQHFKFTGTNAMGMSSTMIALDISPDQTVPKICFRGTSEQDINHWARIFHSLNGNGVSPGSPMFGSMGPSSPIPGFSEGLPARSNHHGATALASAFSGYPTERKRHNTTSAFPSNAATVPSINPILISNAAAAFSNLGMNNGSHGNSNGHSSTLNSNYQNQSQHSTNFGDAKDLELHSPTTSSSRDETRRRAITEPNRLRLMSPQQHRANPKKASKASVPELDMRSMDVSNVSEAPFRLDSPPGRKRRPVLGTECLDNASQVLLATSSARSSMALCYSGYIWLYVPNVCNETKPAETVGRSDVEEPDDLTGAGCPTKKASGRYVKCFAVVNDQGQLHWVEVKKQNENEQELRGEHRAFMRSSYALHLRSLTLNQKENNSVQDTLVDKRSSLQQPTIESSSSVPTSSSSIQVSMVHKLRLFFFRIKIPSSALHDAFLNMSEIRPPSPPTDINNSTCNSTDGHTIGTGYSSGGSATGATAKAISTASKVRHRLSSSLSTLAALPPLPSMRSQSVSGSIAKSGKSSTTWPSLTMLHDKESTAHPPALLQDRAMTAPASTGSTRTMSNRGSTTSLKSSLSAIQTTALKPSSSTLLLERDGQQQQHCQLELSPTSTEALSPSSPCSATSFSSSASSTNVLFLAQNLQKAVMLSRENSATDSNNGHGIGSKTGSSKSSCNSGYSSCANTPPSSKATRPLSKMILSEAMVVNQMEIPECAETMGESKIQLRQEQERLELQIRIQRAEERARIEDQQQQQQQKHDASQCPFLELIKDPSNPEKSFVTLRGYTETEDGWRFLQMALERFLDAPIKDHMSALPPEDTLIPSYHSVPEVQLSEKAQQYLSAKASLIDEANFAASMAAVEAVRSPTPDIQLSTSASSTSSGMQGMSQGPVVQMRATTSSLTRFLNLSGGAGGGTDREKSKKTSSTHRQSRSTSSSSLQGTTFAPNVPDIPKRYSQHLDGMPTVDASASSSAASSASSSPSRGRNSSPISGVGLGFGEGDKAGIPPVASNNTASHSMSVGSGTSLFRTRPRLNPQRSVDELSKSHGKSVGYPFESESPKGKETRHSQSRRGREIAKAFYSTAAAMMNPGHSSSNNVNNNHSSSVSGSGSGSDVSSLYQRHRSKSRSRRATSKSEDHERVETSQVTSSSIFKSPKVKNKSSSGSYTTTHDYKNVHHSHFPTPNYDELLGPRSMSMTTATVNKNTRTMAMVTSFSSIGDSGVYRLHEQQQQQQQQQQKQQGHGSHVEDAQKGDKVNCSSVYSEHTSQMTSNQGIGLGLGLDLGTISPGGESCLQKPNERNLLGQQQGAWTHCEYALGSPPRHRSSKGDGLHPFDPQGMMRGDETRGAGGELRSGKKQQTVLEASKAAVSGVFGKFRKSVG